MVDNVSTVAPSSPHHSIIVIPLAVERGVQILCIVLTHLTEQCFALTSSFTVLPHLEARQSLANNGEFYQLRDMYRQLTLFQELTTPTCTDEVTTINEPTATVVLDLSTLAKGLSLHDLEDFEEPEYSKDEFNNAFAITEWEFLHGAPVSKNPAPAARGKAKAWVVFNGRETGVFETWYGAFSLHTEAR